MTKAKLLGYTEISNHQEPDEYSEHPTGGTDYKFYIGIGAKIYYFEAHYWYGSCYSGYTTASNGSLENILIPVQELPAEIILPLKECFVNVVENIDTKEKRVEKSFRETEYRDDSIVEQVITTDGDLVVLSTGDGGDQYYSCGIARLGEKIFKVEIHEG